MRNVTAEIRISERPSKVLSVFTDVEAIKQWWGADRGLIDKRVGGVWALAWERSAAGFRYVTTGVIGSLEPNKFLRIDNMAYFNPEHMVFGPMNLTVTVREDNGGTLLKVDQGGYQTGPEWDWYYKAVSGAWPEVVKRIKEFVEKSTAPVLVNINR